MGNGRRSSAIRTIFRSVRAYGKTHRCTCFHQKISQIASCAFNTRIFDGWTDSHTSLDRFTMWLRTNRQNKRCAFISIICASLTFPCTTSGVDYKNLYILYINFHINCIFKKYFLKIFRTHEVLPQFYCKNVFQML